VSVYERLEALNIALPKLTPPVAAFVPFLRSGNLIFLAGHIAKLDGQPWGRSVGCESNDRAREKRRTRRGHRSDGRIVGHPEGIGRYAGVWITST